jgi:hypothetical protein
MQLLTYARNHVGTHFKYVYDTAEGNIKVNMNGKSLTVATFGDVDRMIEESGRARDVGQGTSSNLITPTSENAARTRSQKKNQK